MHEKFDIIRKNMKRCNLNKFFENITNDLPDGYKTNHKNITEFVFMGILNRMESLSEIVEYPTNVDICKDITNTGDADTVRNCLSDVNSNLQLMFNEFNKLIKRMIKHIDIDNITYTTKNNYKIIPMGLDGTDFFKSKTKTFNGNYIIRKYPTKNGESTFNVFNGSVISTVGTKLKMILDVEYEKKQDGSDKNDCELSVYKRLIKRINKFFKDHNKLVIVDALYSNSQFINNCLNNNIHSLIRLKDNASTIIEEAEYDFLHFGSTKKKSFDKSLKPFGKIHHVDVYKTINTTFCGTPLYVYKFIENGDIKHPMLCYTTCEMLSPYNVWFLMHKRWDQENIFADLTKQYHITHNYGGEAKELINLLTLIAYNIINILFTENENLIAIVNGAKNYKATFKYFVKENLTEYIFSNVFS